MSERGTPGPDGTPPAAEGSDPVEVIRQAGARGLTLATAESLTAGAVVARLVDVPGASAVIAGGAACYSLEAKTRVLGVDAALLAATGAVTAEVAAAMAEGARSLYGTDLAVSTTGVAGPGPDERGIAEGTVVLALARRDRPTRTRELRLSGGRARIRASTVDAAIQMLSAALSE
ncbi:MAG: CinA family protein [Brachybacterium sp.]|uniref:CinA family protein n=1 Tax=Brachybacterium sp. TaxID=1891286 RepID=UPI003F8EED9E